MEGRCDLAPSQGGRSMRRVLPLLVLLLMGFAPVPPYRPKPDTSKADLKALQGEWHRVRVTVGGTVHTEVGKETTIVITDGRMSYAVAGKPTNEWDFTLNGRARP